MSRLESLEKAYPGFGPQVLSSINKVARAGRTGDAAKIEAERERHYAFMASIKKS